MADAQTDLKAAIEAQDKMFVEAFSRGNAAGIAALYTEDAILLPPGMEPMTGPTAAQAFWQGAMDMGLKGATLETLSVEAQGDVAIEIGKYTLTVAGRQPVDNGKYIVVWKQEGGAWKLYKDIWNSSVPQKS